MSSSPTLPLSPTPPVELHLAASAPTVSDIHLSTPPVRSHTRAGHSMHAEIFTFKRMRGKDAGREWVRIIQPVVERWASFVSLLP